MWSDGVRTDESSESFVSGKFAMSTCITYKYNILYQSTLKDGGNDSAIDVGVNGGSTGIVIHLPPQKVQEVTISRPAMSTDIKLAHRSRGRQVDPSR